jgi:hypothetical protein
VDDQVPLVENANHVQVQIGGYKTIVLMPDELDAALEWLEPRLWREIGQKMHRLQRDAKRP